MQALYLPPYSPDLDPIEEAFSKIKGFFEGPRPAPKRPQSRCWGRRSRWSPARDAHGFFEHCGHSAPVQSL